MLSSRGSSECGRPRATGTRSRSWPSSQATESRGDCHRRSRHLVSSSEAIRGDAMKVFIAGATGAIGRQLVPRLVDRGHEVYGMTRHASKKPLVRDLGARPVVADALDPEEVARAV